MKAILDQFSSPGAHWVAGFFIGGAAEVTVLLCSPNTAPAGVVFIGFFFLFGGSLLSRSLSSYAQSVRSNDDDNG